MARKGRETSSLGIYHIILRGNDGLFFCERDCKEFLQLLKKYFSSENKIFAYSLDNTRIHLVIFTGGAASAVLKPLCTSYARYINRVHQKTGKLFYDRFISIPVEDTESLVRAVRYTAKMPSHLTSLSEYKKKAGICSVDALSDMIPIKAVTASGAVIPSDDDFTSMTDAEIKQLITALFGSSETDGEKFPKFLTDAVKFSNLSMARLARVFEIKPLYGMGKPKRKSQKSTSGTEKKKTQKNEPKKPVEKPSVTEQQQDTGESPKKKKELSVWLL